MQINGFDDLVLPLDELLLKCMDTIHDCLQTRDIMQNCVQLVLAFGDNGTDALVFELNRIVIGIGVYRSRVRSFEVEYLRLLMVNNASDKISSRMYDCS